MVDDTIFKSTGLAKEILSRPGIEGDPLAFLKATEAYWKVQNLLGCPLQACGPAIGWSEPKAVDKNMFYKYFMHICGAAVEGGSSKSKCVLVLVQFNSST